MLASDFASNAWLGPHQFHPQHSSYPKPILPSPCFIPSNWFHPQQSVTADPDLFRNSVSTCHLPIPSSRRVITPNLFQHQDGSLPQTYSIIKMGHYSKPIPSSRWVITPNLFHHQWGGGGGGGAADPNLFHDQWGCSWYKPIPWSLSRWPKAISSPMGGWPKPISSSMGDWPKPLSSSVGSWPKSISSSKGSCSKPVSSPTGGWPKPIPSLMGSWSKLVSSSAGRWPKLILFSNCSSWAQNDHVSAQCSLRPIPSSVCTVATPFTPHDHVSAQCSLRPISFSVCTVATPFTPPPLHSLSSLCWVEGGEWGVGEGVLQLLRSCLCQVKCSTSSSSSFTYTPDSRVLALPTSPWRTHTHRVHRQSLARGGGEEWVGGKKDEGTSRQPPAHSGRAMRPKSLQRK